MKKIILSAVVTGVVITGISSNMKVQADDSLNGNTEIGAEVTKGDVTLVVDSTVDFGTQVLSDTVDFGSRDINYTVTDYSGTVNGFELSAKLLDQDEKRSLKLNGTELSDTATTVVSETSNEFGENEGIVTSELVYSGVENIQTYNSLIEWNLTKGTTSQISE